MASYFLMGGHDFDLGKSYILERLLNLTKKECPNILFVPLAGYDSNRTIDNFKIELKDLTYNLEVLYLTKLPLYDDIIKLIDNCDILYFSGGSTIFLVDFLLKNKYNKILDYASEKNIIIAGVSAGANMLSQYGLTDIESYEDNGNYYNYKIYKGLGYINIGFCPHFDLNDRILYFKDYVIKNNINAYACEEDSAIYIKDNNIQIFKIPKQNVYSFKKESNFMMEKMKLNNLITLGPSGTFSDLAAKLVSEKNNIDYNICLYPTISLTAKEIAKNGYGILPFENTLDGYVQETLDMLNKYNLYIESEISLPIHFCFISKSSDISKVKKIYVQFKAKGQCLDFINEHKFEVIETESNIISYDKLKNSGETYGAIVPIHLDTSYFKLRIDNVEDSNNNFTRFLVLSTEMNNEISLNSKCSLILEALIDEPGILIEALVKFYALRINLNAIMSRPTKEGLGKYYFYTEFLASGNINEIQGLIERINSEGKFKIKCLGFYNKL